MDDTKFSVVIPLYNKEQSIANTLLSVIKQSYQNFEIVVINDGSTDNSVDAIKTINDERIRLINQKNQGVSAARNRGIKEASYEWIAFLDGDDLWECNHLEEIVKMMKVFPENKVYVTSFEFSDKRKMFKHERKSKIFKIDNYFKEAMKENLLWTSVVVLHCDCIRKVGCFNINLNRGEDLDLWMRLAKEFNIIKSQEITAIYNLQDSNSLTKFKSNYNKSLLSIIDLKDKKGSERLYLKKIIINRIKLNIKTFDIKGLLRIFFKHNFELFR